MKKPRTPKTHSKTKVSLWYREGANVIRMLQPDGRVYYNSDYSTYLKFVVSVYSEPTVNLALKSLSQTHEFLGYI